MNPATSNLYVGVVVPIPTLPAESIRTRSIALVEIPKVVAAGQKSPVVNSVMLPSDGLEAVPGLTRNAFSKTCALSVPPTENPTYVENRIPIDVLLALAILGADNVPSGTKICPLPMVNFPVGLLVPIPTFPFAKTVKSVDVAVPAVVEAMVKSGVLAAVLAELERERSE